MDTNATRTTTITIPEWLWEMVSIKAVKERTSFTAVTERALRSYLKVPEGEGAA